LIDSLLSPEMLLRCGHGVECAARSEIGEKFSMASIWAGFGASVGFAVRREFRPVGRLVALQNTLGVNERGQGKHCTAMAAQKKRNWRGFSSLRF